MSCHDETARKKQKGNRCVKDLAGKQSPFSVWIENPLLNCIFEKKSFEGNEAAIHRESDLALLIKVCNIVLLLPFPCLSPVPKLPSPTRFWLKPTPKGIWLFNQFLNLMPYDFIPPGSKSSIHIWKVNVIAKIVSNYVC